MQSINTASQEAGRASRLRPTSGYEAVMRPPLRAISRIDLGTDPPIDADGQKHTADDRRKVSFRWLSGTIMTAIVGALLMGMAIFAALDSRSLFADYPVFVTGSKRDSNSASGSNPNKGDRLVKSVDIVSAKQTFKAATILRIGDREVLRQRGFSKVSTGLILASVGFGDDVPAFNPLKLLADARNSAEVNTPDAGPVQDEADVTFVTRDLVLADVQAATGTLSLDEVAAQVAEHLKNSLSVGNQPPLPLPPQMLLMRTSRAGLDKNGLDAAGLGPQGLNPGPGAFPALTGSGLGSPFSSIEVRMIAENVTNVERSPAKAAQGGNEERLVVVRKGETIEDILRAADAGVSQTKSIAAAFRSKADNALREGQRIKLLFADLDGQERRRQLAKISFYTDDRLIMEIAVTDEGQYVLLEDDSILVAPQKKTTPAGNDEEDEDSPGGMKLYNSLYETALKQDIPRSVINEMVRVFANDVDFQRSVAAGDSFEVFYEEGDDSDPRSDMLYATITTRGESFRYYRFLTPDDGLADYYDENGRSTRKFLLRKPIASGELRSGFGQRYHPILHYSRPHTGVDWAAPIGTPIFAAGNGTVISAGRESGYGNRVEIQHLNGYVTTYNHMSGYARGMKEGLRVRQGQVIGYLGMTGLATGPHLHYEVLVNDHFVDPLRVKLARTREFDGKLLTDFKRERDRIEGLMAKAPNAPRQASKGG